MLSAFFVLWSAMKIVLFLGAGFSRGFGLPVMKEFFDRTNQSTKILEIDKELVRSLRKSARNGASMIQGLHDNLEHVLSFALMNPETRINDNETSSTADRLKQILRRVYSDIKYDVSNNLSTALRQLLTKEQGYNWPHQVTVVTTNYDLLAELGFWSMDFPMRLPFEWAENTKSTQVASLYTRDISAPLLCKVHGSLNFFEGKGDVPLIIESGIARVNGAREDRGDYHLPLMSVAGYENNHELPGVPLLIPPTLYKQQAARTFDATWDAASAAIRKADRITVIGYSFPPSDTYMKYFFGSALVDNTDLGRIDIVDPNADDLVDRIKNQSDFGGHFKELLRPVQREWQTGKYQLSL